MESPIGTLTLFASEKHLHHILWEHETKIDSFKKIIDSLEKSPNNPVIIKTIKQLTEYFLKKRKTFELPLFFNGTQFQIQAWKALTRIPYGQTISYGEQAIQLGDKNKARAVGRANGLNPISIIVPCHRVIGRNGTLTGFGGGLDTKLYLLNLEKEVSVQPR